jgi:hypothetical protein
MPLDKNIRELVILLNAIGLETSSSCGGHEEDVPGSGREPNGSFSISLMAGFNRKDEKRIGQLFKKIEAAEVLYLNDHLVKDDPEFDKKFDKARNLCDIHVANLGGCEPGDPPAVSFTLEGSTEIIPYLIRCLLSW